jgi:hypothetical protein
MFCPFFVNRQWINLNIKKTTFNLKLNIIFPDSNEITEGILEYALTEQHLRGVCCELLWKVIKFWKIELLASLHSFV